MITKETYNNYLVPIMALMLSFSILFLVFGILLFELEMIVIGIILIVIPVIIYKRIHK
jgi:hypothetical protein